MTSDKLTNEELDILRNIRIHKILGIQDNGRIISINCPFHSDKSPSCIIYPNNGFHCFGCGQNGRNAIDFCQALGYSFQDSLKELSTYI